MTQPPDAKNADEEPRAAQQVEQRYVAFCDVLGFSDAVVNRFDATIAVYEEFMLLLRNWPIPEKATVTMYSDSLLVVSTELPAVLQAVKNLWFAAMTHDWLIRGGIAYGRYWERRENGNLFVVSDALVRAVQLESSIRHPCVGFSPEVELHMDAWTARFIYGAIAAPVVHFEGQSLVNPFNPYWFNSAHMRVSQMKEQFPQHSAKYDWFIRLWEAVGRDEPLLPPAMLQRMLDEGVIEHRPGADQKPADS